MWQSESVPRIPRIPYTHEPPWEDSSSYHEMEWQMKTQSQPTRFLTPTLSYLEQTTRNGILVYILHSTLQKLEINWILEWPRAPVLENSESLWDFFLKEISSSTGSKQCTKHDVCPKCEYAKPEYGPNFDSDWADTGAVPRRAETPWVLSGTTKASTQGMARTPAAIRLFAEAMVQTLGLAERNAWDNFQTHTLPVWHCFPVLEFFPVAPRCSSEHQVHQPQEK